MNKNPKIEIKSTENGKQTEIFIDGHKLHGVRKFKLEQYATDTPVLTVDLNALDVSVDSICILKHEGFSSEMEISFKTE